MHWLRMDMSEHLEPPSMNREGHLPMFVVDVLRYDIEQISNIVTLLNDAHGVGWRVFWPRDFDEFEVFDALKKLLEMGYVEPLIESLEERAIVPFPGAVASLEEAKALWFVLTRKGWDAWKQLGRLSG
jgi:hypothetical protein